MMSRHLAPIAALAATFAALFGASGSAGTKPQHCNSNSPKSSCPPANTSPPTISGKPVQGQTLSGGTGDWDGTPPIAFAYAWRRCDTNGANCNSIPGATNQSYTLDSGDVGSTIRLTVTATSAFGNSLADSQATETVSSAPPQVPPPSPPSDATPPAISGEAIVGQTLTASPGSWSGSSPISYGYQWKRCDTNGASCSSISGANNQNYVPGSVDVGDTLRVSVTASNPAGSSQADSAPTLTVKATDPSADTTPPTAPSGLAVSNTTQTALSVSWKPSTDNVTVTGYTLYSNGNKVGTTAGTSYTFSGLSCGTSYTIGVSAYDAAGNQSQRSILVASTGACSTRPISPASGGIWISAGELAALPTTGTAWSNVKARADQSWDQADVDCQSSKHDVQVLAAAYVGVRLDSATYKQKARDGIAAAIGSENDTWSCAGNRAAGVGRNLFAYLVAADVLDLKQYDSALDTEFRAWVGKLITWLPPGETKTVANQADMLADNVGTYARASMAAAAVYLGDSTLLQHEADLFRFFLGDRNSPARTILVPSSPEMKAWLIDPTNPQFVAPVGGVHPLIGTNISGALVDLGRGGLPTWCPGFTIYPGVATNGIVAEALILARAGYPALDWEDQAVKRTMAFLYRLKQECGWEFPPANDEAWQTWVVNRLYGTSYTTVSPVEIGPNMSYTDWTHGS